VRHKREERGFDKEKVIAALVARVGSGEEEVREWLRGLAEGRSVEGWLEEMREAVMEAEEGTAAWELARALGEAGVLA
jgi:hypothetical protein